MPKFTSRTEHNWSLPLIDISSLDAPVLMKHKPVLGTPAMLLAGVSLNEGFRCTISELNN
jgi:hypothetical protein